MKINESSFQDVSLDRKTVLNFCCNINFETIEKFKEFVLSSIKEENWNITQNAIVVFNNEVYNFWQK